VSNGVKAFREPAVKKRTAHPHRDYFYPGVLLAGISYLVKAYGIAATDPGQPGYQSLLSMLIAAVFGKGYFYDWPLPLSLSSSRSPPTPPSPIFRVSAAPSRKTITFRMLSGTAAGALSTRTHRCPRRALWRPPHSFRRCHRSAHPRSMPSVLSWPSLFRSPHGGAWWRKRGPHWVKSALVNGLGAFVTGVTVIVGAGCEIRGRRLDYAALHTSTIVFFQRGPPPLPCDKVLHLFQGSRPHAGS